MGINREQEQFLQSVIRFNEEFNSIQAGSDVVPLYHSFWDENEISKAEEMKAEWGVPGRYVPFYGDWHDLFCLDRETGHVHSLDDSRTVVHSWDSISQFVRSLSNQEEEPSQTRNILGGTLWFDDHPE